MNTTPLSIHTEFIELSQALKRADLVQSGGEAKFHIQQGEVQVNGEPEMRRGRKLRPGDQFSFQGQHFEIVAQMTP